MLGASDLRFISAISTAPSLAAAARSLNVTPPAVSQRLTAIEERLALRLVERGSGAIHLTSDGELLAHRSAKILAEIDILTEDLATRRGAIIGPLRIVAPFGFGRMHVAPCMASFAKLHAEVTLSLNLTEDPRGAMRSDKWDVLVHVGRLPDLNISRRKLSNNRRILCAAPSYLTRHGNPFTPHDLSTHHCGVVREDQSDVTLWPLKGANGKQASVRIQPVFASNDGEVIRAWALDGLGIVERSEWSVSHDLQNGHLVEVLPDWSLPAADIVALVNTRTVRAARIEAFVNHLAASCQHSD